ncbi:diguanylate cyclase [Oceanobacter sp. 5_MG-2023]|uniref:diguanylate cyclase domain-containing protein n=1 Tax=Oceanobacter sp. 5_MG-2023 TaxID=3062645 RepID=UPI0026E3C0BC|nr:diguanylate cyclase [Oceanobacter sp. 5_MG-2023]MDO6682502.1 diguanylate cyclase [Oceanobacter sp. 5_MG-2023]
MNKSLTVLIASASPSDQTLLASVLPATSDVMSLNSLAQLEACLLQFGRYPSLLILAMDLPGLDFAAFMAQRAEDPLYRYMEVVAVGAASVDQEIMALDAGAALYLKQPLQVPLVAARLGVLERQYQRIRQLKALSMTDGLTGIANRRRFDEFLLAEWRRAQRQQSNLAVMMVDVDAFKAFNDRYGHVQGDEALCQVARALNDSVNRSHDLVARYGGEEFSIVLPLIEPEGVAIVAQRMLAAVAALRLENKGSPAGPWLSISIGSGWFQPMMSDPVTMAIEVADKALYQAKNTGRARHQAAALPR